MYLSGSGLLVVRVGVGVGRVVRVRVGLCGGLGLSLVVAAVGVRVGRLGLDGLSGGLLVLGAVRVGRVRGLLLLGSLLGDGLGLSLGLRVGRVRAVRVHLLVRVAGGLGGGLLLALLGLLGGLDDLLCDVLALLGVFGLADAARLDLGGLDLGGGGLLGALVLCHCDVLVFWRSRSVRFETLSEVAGKAVRVWWRAWSIGQAVADCNSDSESDRHEWCERPVMVAVCGKPSVTHDHTK